MRKILLITLLNLSVIYSYEFELLTGIGDSEDSLIMFTQPGLHLDLTTSENTGFHINPGVLITPSDVTFDCKVSFDLYSLLYLNNNLSLGSESGFRNEMGVSLEFDIALLFSNSSRWNHILLSSSFMWGVADMEWSFTDSSFIGYHIPDSPLNFIGVEVGLNRSQNFVTHFIISKNHSLLLDISLNNEDIFFYYIFSWSAHGMRR